MDILYLVLETVGIVYLGRSRNRRIMMLYVLVIQLFFTVAGLSILGIYIGIKIDPEGTLPTILAASGLFLGVIVSFFTILQFLKSEERYERSSQD